MKDDGRKLRRGLSDLSPLFQIPGKVESKPDSSAALAFLPGFFQMISLWSPEPEISSSLNEGMVAFLEKQQWDVAVAKIDQGAPTSQKESRNSPHRPRRSLSLSNDQFEILYHAGFKPPQGFENTALFLDFDYSNPFYFERLMPALDKWVLWVHPDLGSLTESFRYLKSSLGVNQKLQYFMISDTADLQTGERLYEGFSELVSRRLGIGMNWIGFSEKKTFPTLGGEIHWEALRNAPLTLPEKNRFPRSDPSRMTPAQL